MKSRAKETKASVLLNQRIKGPYYRLRLGCPELARRARPGQFILLRVRDGLDPLLRRPFSFARIRPPAAGRGKGGKAEGEVEIWYKVVGHGTELMAKIKEGEHIDLLGPLGNGFWPWEGKKTAILLAGGIGIAPLLSLAEDFSQKRKKPLAAGEERPETIVIMGGKSREGILGLPELKRMGFHPQITTEDGSLGIQGMATDLLERILLTHEAQKIAIYMCGPWPMLARVAEISQQFDLPCQALVESRMACGLGACLGCAIEVKEDSSAEGMGPATLQVSPNQHSNGPEEGGEGEAGIHGAMPGSGHHCRYALTCREGPVFDARSVSWGSRNL